MGKLVNNPSDTHSLAKAMQENEIKVNGLEDALTKANKQLEDLEQIAKKDESARRIAELEALIKDKDDEIAQYRELTDKQMNKLRDFIINSPTQPVDEKPPVSEEEKAQEKALKELEAEKQRRNQEYEDFYNKFYNK